jgi:ATP-binding cassette subfamily C protein/ATP-binding cassette subfamily C protein LapB
MTALHLNKPLHTEEETPFTRALVNSMEPLLDALNWSGQQEHLMSALPYVSGIKGVSDFIKTMETLNYEHHSFNTTLEDLSIHFTPCLFVTEDNKVFVVLKKNTINEWAVFDGQSEKETVLRASDLKGCIYFFKMSKSIFLDFAFLSRIPFIKLMAKPYQSMLVQCIIVSFILAVLALVVPLFSRMVFDQVIPSRSSGILMNFLFAIIVVILVSGLLNLLMSKLLIVSGVKLSDKVNNSILKRLLYLSPVYTEGTTVNAQVARVKDFDHVREFLVGPIFRLFFELVFVILGVAVIAYIGGWLVLVPIVSMILYILFYYASRGFVRDTIALSAKLSTERQNFILESFVNMRALKYLHAEKKWMQRYNAMSAEATIQNFNASELNSTINAVLDLIMAGTGFAIICFGAIGVMDNTLTFGSLIAIMIISARMVSPLKGLFGSQARIQQFTASVKQVNALMTIPPERDPNSLLQRLDNLKGGIQFNNVSFRYPNAMEFALSNVNFEVKAGETVAIVGPIGSGKSTLLKLMLGLYANQGGSIMIDGIDIRQYDVMNLRYSVGYVSQANYIFFGTVAQNLLLAKPTATEDELMYSARRADILDDILAMPDGFETTINDQSILQLSPGFQQRLALARTYLKKPSIILFDEPVTALDEQGANAFVEAIKYFKGHATMFIVTHRPSHLQLVDQILVLNRGQMILSGTSSQVLAKLTKESV